VPQSVKFPRNELAKRLKKVSILRALSPRQLSTLAKWAEVFDFTKGETVVKRGDKGDGLYLILDGTAEVRRGGRKLARLGAGQFFGEMSLFDNLPRSADVVTVDSSKLAVLQKWSFWGFAASQPGVVLSILEEMSHRLRAANHALAD
jgi:CRP/FNR family cyclic AMP-dependent transcriptional regulator